MNKWLIATGLAAAMGMSAWAEPGAHGEGGGPGGHREHGGLEARIGALLQDDAFTKEVGLTDDQVKAVRDALYTHEKETVKLQADTELAQMEIKNLMNQDTPDHEAVMKAVDKAGAAMTALRKSDIENRLKIRSIVGPEALKKIKAHLREMAKENGNGPRGHGQRPGPVSDNGQGPPPGMDDGMPPPELAGQDI